MQGAIGFENLQNFRYLYAPKRRCINDFIAIYEERISIWKRGRCQDALMYAWALLGGLHAEHLLSRHKRYAGRCGKKNWRIHVSTNWNRIKKEHINTESTGQKLSGAFRSYPHLGHGLGQRRFRGFYVHVRPN